MGEEVQEEPTIGSIKGNKEAIKEIYNAICARNLVI